MKVDQTPSLLAAKGVSSGGIFVEVGTWEGGFSHALLSQTACAKLYCVDPYKHFINNEYPDGMNDLSQKQFDDKYAATQQYLQPFGTRVEFIRAESVLAAAQFEDNSLDFVYIDGNHDYKYVLNDIRTWYPKVKPGGVLCGDDVYSTSLEEHDADGNVTRVWSKNIYGAPSCWGKYGTYKAAVDSGIPFTVDGTQFRMTK
jgi:hypothetical protein